MSKPLPNITALRAEDITLTGNSIVPEFSPDETEYKFFVQSDIYGVKIYAKAEDNTRVYINGKESDSDGVLIQLKEDMEHYGVDYSEIVEIKAVREDAEKIYTVEIVRENAKYIYELFTPHIFEDSENGVKLPYELYLPSNYKADKKYPLVFVLHGAGQRLQPVDMVLKRYESATIWAKDSEKGINQCIVVSPQCAEASGIGWTHFMDFLDNGNINAEHYKFTKWGLAAYNLLQYIKENYSVDLSRIYVTGVSMGGFGTFEMAVEHKDEIAAVVPICGGGNPKAMEKLKGLPIWIFHAIDDPLVDYNMWCVPTMKALDDAGVEYKKTIYEAGKVFYPSGHFSWTPAYADKEMRKWLFEQRK